MQDELEITSSQEDTLIRLSQENYGSLFYESTDELPAFSDIELTPPVSVFVSGPQYEVQNLDNQSELLADTSVDSYVPELEPIPRSTPLTSLPSSLFPPDSTVLQYASSCLPASNNWAGDFGFNIHFGPQEKKTGTVNWTYSENRDKLYALKGAPCQINFGTNCTMPSDTNIRIQSIFTQSDHATDIVRRCVNHTLEDANNGVSSPDHLIRCEIPKASYEVDPSTHRQSLVLPYENPPMGQNFSTYILKFVCYGSCPGGLNRRPIKVIFTLERGNEVIGRRSLEVKICACPGRDCRTDDKQDAEPETSKKNPQSDSLTKKRKDAPDGNTHLMDVFKFIDGISCPPAKKTKSAPAPNADGPNADGPNAEGTYSIIVHDRDEYEFLKQVRLLYELTMQFRNLNPSVTRALIYGMQRVKKEKGSTDESD